jgi:hypothetical protein
MEHEPHLRHTRARTVAWFSSNEEVRAATVALERHGIDSVHIDVARAPSVSDRRRIDRSSMSWMGRRAVVGGAIGALVGLVIGLTLGSWFDAKGVDLVGAIIAAVIFLTPIGGFLALATGLPVTDEVFDTFGHEPEGQDWVSVGGPKDVQDAAASVLQSLDPVRISAFGDDTGPVGPGSGE